MSGTMTCSDDEYLTTACGEAEIAGAEAGTAAATWQDDFTAWTDADLASLLGDGDPAILDRFTLPPVPAGFDDEDAAIAAAWTDAAEAAFWDGIYGAAMTERDYRAEVTR